MPVIVVKREGDTVEFTRENSDYHIDEVGTLHVTGETTAAFQSPAWSYVIKKPSERLPNLADVGGQLRKATSADVTYNIRAGNTEKAFKEAQRRENRGKQQ